MIHSSPIRLAPRPRVHHQLQYPIDGVCSTRALFVCFYIEVNGTIHFAQRTDKLVYNMPAVWRSRTDVRFLQHSNFSRKRRLSVHLDASI